MLQLLKETIVFRARIFGGKVDADLLSGVEPQPSSVFRQLLHTGACSHQEIADFIKSLKELRDDGEQLVTPHGLETLVNELWKAACDVRCPLHHTGVNNEWIT
jgi:hypothetical protein